MADTVAAAPSQKPRVRKPKFTFMLHNADTFESLGKFVSTDFRYSALKVASRGHKKILLRKTNSKIVYEYTGDVVDIEPTIVKRGEREIRYTKKPVVKFIRKFVYDGEIPDDEPGETTAPVTTNDK